jgi:hypothetical protein
MEVACGGGRLVKEGKLVSLSHVSSSITEVGKLLGSEGRGHAVEAGAIKAGSGSLPSRSVLGLFMAGGAITGDYRSMPRWQVSAGLAPCSAGPVIAHS